jgi:hypothetical protein
MRTNIILLLVALLLTISAQAQPKKGLIYRGKQRFVPCVDIGVGYIWDHKYEKYTISTMFNNIISRQYGFFSVVELDKAAPAVVLGPTITVYDFAYIWAGIDIFTSRGYFARGFTHSRKDLGIGFYPFRWATVKIAHSFNSNSRIEIGIRIPLERDPAYLRLRKRF